MKYTARCFVVFLGLLMGAVFMAPAGDQQTTGLLMTWVMAAFGVTFTVAVLEVFGLMGRVLAWLAGWNR